MDKSHNQYTKNNKKRYIMTMHAKERYIERVQNANKKFNKGSALNWVTQAINNGHVVSEKDGEVCYRYQKYMIVVRGNSVITISYHNDRDVKPLKEDLKATIARRLRKAVKPLVKNRKEVLIKANEVEIEVLKSTTRSKQLRLNDVRDKYRQEGKSLKSQITAIIDLGSQYGVAKQDLIQDSDLI